MNMKHAETIKESVFQKDMEVESSVLMESPYDQFVPELLASYASVGGLNNRDAHNITSPYLSELSLWICQRFKDLYSRVVSSEFSNHLSRVRALAKLNRFGDLGDFY